MKKIASMTTLCASIFMATQVRSDDLPEYHCFHTCPETTEGTICDTKFVEVVPIQFASLTDDERDSIDKLPDGRSVNMWWMQMRRYPTQEKFVLVAEFPIDRALGGLIATFDFTQDYFTMGALGATVDRSPEPINFQVEGKCIKVK